MAANDVPCCEPMFWLYLVICIALVSFAGLMSGLTLGLMSLSQVDLEILAKAGQPQDRKNAEKILPIVKNQHLLLCTLLIGNSLAMEALPIFLDALLPAWGAILISVTLILAFGEIIPQAICSRYGLNVGAKLSGLVRLLIIAIFPLSYPISKVLDWLLGKGHSALLRRAELKMFVDMHGNEAGKGGELTHDETTIITGALDLTQKTVKDAMTPLSKTFSLDINSKLDETTMELLISKGHSRVPIYSGSPENIIGIILVKNLMKCRPEDGTPIRDANIRKVPRVLDSLPLYDILNEFQKGNSHMAVVVKSKHNVKGTAGVTKRISTRGIMNQQEATGGSDQQFSPNGQLSISVEDWGPNVKNTLELPQSSLHTNSKKVKQGDRYVTGEEWELLPNTDEEVIGIITLEDVIEELLQEEILDETDGYVEVHNKISINMLQQRSPLSRSPALPRHWRSPLASPVSPYHLSPASSRNHTPPIMRSPVTHNSRSPSKGPPEESYSTARSPSIMQSTPTLVVRYEKLHKSSGSRR